jgi:DNA-binding response OmpR family regulator
VSIKILLLEDDLLFGETMIDLLEDEGYRVFHVPNGQSALDATFENKFDLYLLDINVPLLNGIALLKELREANDNTPAIFLTSHKEKEKIQEGFVSGCDDYIIKPFDMDEMLLRIEALLRRSNQKSSHTAGVFRHDMKHKTIYYKEKELELSQKEYELLVLFIRHHNEIVPKELILDELWSSAEGGSDGALRVYINRLKQLLPDVILENIRGIGYRLVS